MSRSTFVMIVFALLSLFHATPLHAKVLPSLQNDGTIPIFNYHEREYREITYRQDDTYSDEGLEAIKSIFRSRMNGKTHAIDLQLIELLDHLQDHFHAETLEIISGYRSDSYNAFLRENGRSAAQESLHKVGKAADIHLDEVREEDLFSYVKKLGVGGAGLYPRYAFVHVDVGAVRNWSEAKPPRRILVGTENNPNPAWSAITDKNSYKPGETIRVTIRNEAYRKQRWRRNVWYERFRKGKWAEQVRLEKDRKTVTLKPGETASFAWSVPPEQTLGKYRLVIFPDKDLSVPPAYSNEFFLRNPQKSATER